MILRGSADRDNGHVNSSAKVRQSRLLNNFPPYNLRRYNQNIVNVQVLGGFLRPLPTRFDGIFKSLSIFKMSRQLKFHVFVHNKSDPNSKDQL